MRTRRNRGERSERRERRRLRRRQHTVDNNEDGDDGATRLQAKRNDEAGANAICRSVAVRAGAVDKMDLELLISLVRHNELLYDMSHKRYNDVKRKEKVWRDIAKKLQSDGATCKRTWAGMRDTYRRALKRKRESTNESSGTGVSGNAKPRKQKNWRFEDQMSFLLPHMKEREMKKKSMQQQQQELHKQEQLMDDESSDGNDNDNDHDIVHSNVEVSIHGNDHDNENDNDNDNENDHDNDNDNENDTVNVNVNVNDTCKTDLTAPANSLTAAASANHVNIWLPQPTTPTTMTPPPLHTLTTVNCEDVVGRGTDNHQDIRSFFSFMADTVMHFSALNQHRIKSKIFSIVAEMEYEEIIQAGAGRG